VDLWSLDLLIRYEERQPGGSRPTRIHHDMSILWRNCATCGASPVLGMLSLLVLSYIHQPDDCDISVFSIYLRCQWCQWKRKMPVISHVSHCGTATSSKTTPFFLNRFSHIFPASSWLPQQDFASSAVRNTLRISFPNCETDPRCSIQVPDRRLSNGWLDGWNWIAISLIDD